MGVIVMAAAVSFLDREPILVFVQFIAGAALIALGIAKLRDRATQSPRAEQEGKK
jgi:hypothetical protein